MIYSRKLLVNIVPAAVGLLLLCAAPALAQEAAEPGMRHLILGTIQFFCLGLFVYYMLVILPKNAQETDHKKFLDGLKKGDEVVTTSGFLGRVASVKPESITVELAPNVKVKVLPKHVQPPPSASGRDEQAETAAKESGAKDSAAPKKIRKK